MKVLISAFLDIARAQAEKVKVKHFAPFISVKRELEAWCGRPCRPHVVRVETGAVRAS